MASGCLNPGNPIRAGGPGGRKLRKVTLPRQPPQTAGGRRHGARAPDPREYPREKEATKRLPPDGRFVLIQPVESAPLIAVASRITSRTIFCNVFCNVKGRVDMPMEADALSDLKSLIAAARRGPLAFGVCMGKKPEETVMLLHAPKAPRFWASRPRNRAKPQKWPLARSRFRARKPA